LKSLSKLNFVIVPALAPIAGVEKGSPTIILEDVDRHDFIKTLAETPLRISTCDIYTINTNKLDKNSI